MERGDGMCVKEGVVRGIVRFDDRGWWPSIASRFSKGRESEGYRRKGVGG